MHTRVDLTCASRTSRLDSLSPDGFSSRCAILVVPRCKAVGEQSGVYTAPQCERRMGRHVKIGVQIPRRTMARANLQSVGDTRTTSAPRLGTGSTALACPGPERETRCTNAGPHRRRKKCGSRACPHGQTRDHRRPCVNKRHASAVGRTCLPKDVASDLRLRASVQDIILSPYTQATFSGKRAEFGDRRRNLAPKLAKRSTGGQVRCGVLASVAAAAIC